jgi:hypothetical protein
MPFIDRAEQAELVVFRKRQFSDSGGCYVVNVNGVELGVLASGGFLRTLVPPGVNEISMPHIGTDLVLRFDAQPGGIHYVEHMSILGGMGVVPMGNFAATNVQFTFVLAEMDSEYASELVADLRNSLERRRCMATLRPR